MIRIGVLGYSEGNGHPFSFSAIVNGYDAQAFVACGFPAIANYLSRRQPEDFGIADARVTHVWMPDPAMAHALSRACRVDRVVASADEMVGEVDAVLIARDDAQSHWPLAAPFLARGVPVFVDKPLALDHATLDAFSSHLEAGRAMSCSGLLYAAELDSPMASRADFGGILALRGTVVNDWSRYAIHALEPGLWAARATAVAVRRLPAMHAAYAVELADGRLFQIDMLGPRAPGISLSILGAARVAQIDFQDNFTAFKRCLAAFVGMVRSRVPPIDPAQTRNVVETLIAGLSAEPGGASVPVGKR